MWPWVNHEKLSHNVSFGAQLTHRSSATWAYAPRLPSSTSLVAGHVYNHTNAEHVDDTSNYSATSKHSPNPTQHKTSGREMCGKMLLYISSTEKAGTFLTDVLKLHIFSCLVKASHLPRHFPNYCTIEYSEVGLFLTYWNNCCCLSDCGNHQAKIIHPLTLHATRRLEKLLFVTLQSCSFQHFSIYKAAKYFSKRGMDPCTENLNQLTIDLLLLVAFHGPLGSILQTPRGTQTTVWKILLQRKISTGLITLAHSPETLSLLPS